MEPASAALFALVVTWALARSAATAAVGQARREARTAAAAIRDDLRNRGEAWAQQLFDRLHSGRSGGPSTALWWGWAAARTARALKAALTGDHAGQAQPVRGPRTPYQRIWDAGVRGGRYAWEEAQRQRQAKEKPRHVKVGMCTLCGTVVAETALEMAPTADGTLALMCVNCRAKGHTGRRSDATREDAARPPRDGDTPETKPQIKAPRSELPGPPPSTPAEPQPAVPAPTPAPAVDQPSAPKAPAIPAPAAPAAGQDSQPPRLPEGTSQAADAPTPPVLEGSAMAPRSPGLVPIASRPRLPANGARIAGQSYTHGQWQRATHQIHTHLAQLPDALEAMLLRLTTVDAGREQVAGVMGLHRDAVAFIEQVRGMLADVNRRELPVVDAVAAAGGPDQIPNLDYLSDV